MHNYDDVEGYFRISLGENILHILKSAHFLVGIQLNVAIPISSVSSQPRHRTWVSYIAGGFFTVWAMKETPMKGTKARFRKQVEWNYLLTPVGGKLTKGLKSWLHKIPFLLNSITFSHVEKTISDLHKNGGIEQAIIFNFTRGHLLLLLLSHFSHVQLCATP